MTVRHTWPRRYRGAADLEAMCHMVGTSAAEAGRAGYLHPGDLPHRIYNGLRRFELDDLIWVWEDSAGIAGFALLYPQWQAFDLQIRHDRRDLDPELVDWCVARLPGVVAATGKEPSKVAADLDSADRRRRDALTAAGFGDQGAQFAITTRPVYPLHPAPPGALPIRAVTGVEEAAAVARVHHESFASNWDADGYRRLMESPGYDPSRELVAVAPDGTFAGFVIVWPDPATRTGLFEPVGTSDRFRRRGVARALMAAGLRLMADHGMETAQVLHEMDNPASASLYESMGFTRASVIHDWCVSLDGSPCGDAPAA